MAVQPIATRPASCDSAPYLLALVHSSLSASVRGRIAEEVIWTSSPLMAMRPAAVSCWAMAPWTTSCSSAVFQSAFSSRSCARAMASSRMLMAASASARLAALRMLWRTMAVTMVSMFFMR